MTGADIVGLPRPPPQRRHPDFHPVGAWSSGWPGRRGCPPRRRQPLAQARRAPYRVRTTPYQAPAPSLSRSCRTAMWASRSRVSPPPQARPPASARAETSSARTRRMATAPSSSAAATGRLQATASTSTATALVSRYRSLLYWDSTGRPASIGRVVFPTCNGLRKRDPSVHGHES